MNFMEALKAMKEGKTVSRHCFCTYTAKLSKHDFENLKVVEWYDNGVLDKDMSPCMVDDYEAVDWYIVEDEA